METDKDIFDYYDQLRKKLTAQESYGQLLAVLETLHRFQRFQPNNIFIRFYPENISIEDFIDLVMGTINENKKHKLYYDNMGYAPAYIELGKNLIRPLSKLLGR